MIPLKQVKQVVQVGRMPLDDVHVPQPCGAEWESMDGDVRWLCAGCGCHVHDLSALTRRQAQALLDDPRSGAAEGRLCVRFQTGPGGAILTRDDAPTAVADRTPSWPLRLAVAASWALALAVTGLGLTDGAQAAAPRACVAESLPQESRPGRL